MIPAPRDWESPFTRIDDSEGLGGQIFVKKHAYCTSHCLKSLKYITAPDTQCPNYAKHMSGPWTNDLLPRPRGDEPAPAHPITNMQLLRLIETQLGLGSFQNGLVKTHDRRGKGAIFKLVVWTDGYGYTMVAKGRAAG